MRTTALAHQPALEATLTVMSGPARGTVYRIVSSRVTLGRGADNDIVINDDPKASRNHAEIIFSPHGFEIRDVTDRNVINVDGADCKVAQLRDKSVFTLGLTQFRLSMKPSANLPAAHPSGVSPAMTMQGSSHRRPPTRSSPMRYILLGVIGVALWFGLSDDSKKDPAKTAEQLAEQEMKTAEGIKQSAEERHRPKSVSPNDIGYKQAQQAFVEGFRDYRKGQFERALSSFQACLSLFPSHTLCNRYIRLTQRRFDELIQYHMVLGRKYRDQNQFGACASSFRNVMVMLKDQTNKRYQEAKANYEACHAQVEERF